MKVDCGHSLANWRHLSWLILRATPSLLRSQSDSWDCIQINEFNQENTYFQIYLEWNIRQNLLGRLLRKPLSERRAQLKEYITSYFNEPLSDELIERAAEMNIMISNDDGEVSYLYYSGVFVSIPRPYCVNETLVLGPQTTAQSRSI